MELDASLSWLALALTPGLACRLCARLLRKIGLPDRIFHASLTELESCSLPARVAQASYNKDAFKRAEVFGVPGNVTQTVSYAPNMLIKLGAKLVVNAEDVIEELPTPVRAALVKAEGPETEQRKFAGFRCFGSLGKETLRTTGS
jgi:predicted Rossmann fold nucleotide-binding protein DprA/Smf involved in DNA uptake